MNALDSPRIRLHALSAEDCRLIRLEMDELTKNLHFAGSKRYPALLRYVVEKTLEGHTDELKERTVGIEVFHRPPDYDTNSDTVVRVTAGEVRKRLALTYHESEQDHPIRISLPAGSYVPEFYRLTSASEDATIPETLDESVTIRETSKIEESPNPSLDLALPNETPQNLLASSLGPRARRWRRALASALIFSVAAFVCVWLVKSRVSSVDRFWRPLGSDGAPVLFCAGALTPTPTSSGFTEADRNDDYPYISMATAEALASVVTQLNRNHIEYVIRPSSSSTLTDMRLHPTVLVGAYDNKWTVLMLKDLRFHFAEKPLVEIQDGRAPSRVWRRAENLPYKDKDDYAIVARFHDKVTDNTMVVIAGLGKNGTEAAAQFVTSTRYLDLLNGPSTQGWESRNLEIVLKTAVVDSKTGAPSIEALEVW